jgi:hypothetical protein
MTNLLNETIEALNYVNKSAEDVSYVTDGVTYCTWEDFVKIADFSYDSGYGTNEIRLCLKIVGKGWWLGRAEYDGSESWDYFEPPQKPAVRNSSLKLKADSIFE